MFSEEDKEDMLDLMWRWKLNELHVAVNGMLQADQCVYPSYPNWRILQRISGEIVSIEQQITELRENETLRK